MKNPIQTKWKILMYFDITEIFVVKTVIIFRFSLDVPGV